MCLCGYVPCVDGVCVGFGPTQILLTVWFTGRIRLMHDDSAGKEICRKVTVCGV